MLDGFDSQKLTDDYLGSHSGRWQRSVHQHKWRSSGMDGTGS